MGRLTRSLVTTHTSRVDSISLSYGYFDDSDIARFVRKHSPAFLDLSKIGDNRQAANAIASLGLHILVDLTGHTYNNRLEIACRKPSPILVNYLGFPGSMGCPAYDYAMGRHTGYCK